MTELEPPSKVSGLLQSVRNLAIGLSVLGVAAMSSPALTGLGVAMLAAATGLTVGYVAGRSGRPRVAIAAVLLSVTAAAWIGLSWARRESSRVHPPRVPGPLSR